METIIDKFKRLKYYLICHKFPQNWLVELAIWKIMNTKIKLTYITAYVSK